MADRELYRATKDRRYLEVGTRVVDYLLLTQQVWNHPLLKPQGALGGTTTQNTDAECGATCPPMLLSRRCCSTTIGETGNQDYLERSIAAATSGLGGGTLGKLGSQWIR